MSWAAWTETVGCVDESISKSQEHTASHCAPLGEAGYLILGKGGRTAEKPFLLSFLPSFSEGCNLCACGRGRTGRKETGCDPTLPQTKGADGRPSSVLGWGGVRRHTKERRALPWSSFQPPCIRDGGEGGPAYNKKSLATPPPPLAHDLCSSL